VGYFTSSSLALLARGVVALVKNGGKMQIVASPYLTKEDIEAIELGYKHRDEVVHEAVLRQFDNIEDEIIKKRLSFLAMLISQERLDIKIAVLRSNIHRGIYHEKIGIFEDDSGNLVAFSGSANETESGLYLNFEQIDVFCSWKQGESERAKKKKKNFEDLWINGTRNVEIVDFSEAVKEKLIAYKPYYSMRDPESKIAENLSAYEVSSSNKNDLTVPFELRDYQKKAIRSWFEHDGSGIYEMATGTGKTITALSTAVYWYRRSKKIALIIVCPYSHLVEQWAEESKKFNFDPILAYDLRNKWEAELNRQILSYNLGSSNHFCVITTNKTFISDVFQDSIKKISKNSMIIVDEAHHVGAAETVAKLPGHVEYRLALSATPDRWMDPEGTKKLYDYFSPGVIFTFSLKEAIGKFLTEYYYCPHLIELNSEETEKYHELTRKIARIAGVQKQSFEIDHSTGQSLKYLLIKRAKLIGRAQNKTKKLYELMKDRVNTTHNIFYCGDERVDGVRQLEEVMKVLGYELGMKIHPFTSEESMEERKRILQDFERGNIQGLVAIKCLDEGVDVPATQSAFILASSTNPREFIQRRGRILRKHPSKKYSYIHDFIVIPRGLDETRYLEPSLFNVERALIRKELSRVSEFSSMALNGPRAQEKLLEVKTKYNLLDI
jgi:DNA phosphorothioation system restriction enzyme